MQNAGKQLEIDFKNSVPPNAYYYRVKDSATGWTSTETSTARFTPKNEFDAMLYKSPILFILELKSTKSTAFSFTGKTPMIKEHQIKELTKASKIDGILSGFIFNFRNKNNTYFLNIIDFNNFISSTTKSSINENDIIQHNAIKITQELKRVKYRYDIEAFLNHYISERNNINYD